MTRKAKKEGKGSKKDRQLEGEKKYRWKDGRTWTDEEGKGVEEE